MKSLIHSFVYICAPYMKQSIAIIFTLLLLVTSALAQKNVTVSGIYQG